MFNIGDKIKIGPLQGEIVEKYTKTQIGFIPQRKVSYDIMLKEVPEEAIKPKDESDKRNTAISQGEEEKS